jgi:tripartite-type tricarboxylate transporter receptor subunit TctC
MAMLPRQELKQVAFLTALLIIASFMLYEATKLDFIVRDTIGPGFYPSLVLGALALSTLAALLGVLVRREIFVLSPFISGLLHDTILRGVARAASRRLGSVVRVVERNGAGVFSAAWAGARAGDGTTLTVISSETPDLTSAQAAAWSRAHFAPIARLFFDPDTLVARAGTDLGGLAARDGDPRSGYAAEAATSAPIAGWLARHIGGPRAGSPDELYAIDTESLLARLRGGELDAAVMPLSEAREALTAGTLTALVVFADEEDAGGLGPAAGSVGEPLIAGAWAGLAMPPRAAAASRADALRRAMADGLADFRRGGGGEDDVAWSVASPERFERFLCDIARASDARVSLPIGRLAGLLTAVAGTLGFFWLMQLLGFPLTAFLFMVSVMLLLEPERNRTAMLRIVAVSALVAIGLHQLFWRVFYVVFPDGLVFEI